MFGCNELICVLNVQYNEQISVRPFRGEFKASTNTGEILPGHDPDPKREKYLTSPTCVGSQKCSFSKASQLLIALYKQAMEEDTFVHQYVSTL